eukprot:scaffold22009_cov62-Phaeocystis_antarctica.AAC.1
MESSALSIGANESNASNEFNASKKPGLSPSSTRPRRRLGLGLGLGLQLRLGVGLGLGLG